MAWLTTQIWVELLIAALFGGLIGWALRARSLATMGGSASASSSAAGPAKRVLELEAQLRAQKEETTELRARLAAAVDKQAQAPAAGADEEGSLAWRNRYLESRVRFLEGKVADAGAAPATPAVSADAEGADEPTRLRWRNRYLEGRVQYLEEELARAGGPAADAPVEPAPAARTPVAPIVATVEEGRPQALTAPRDGKPDDLKEIAGIGPKLERTLNDLGVFHFEQIAAWTAAEIAWVNAYISFRGRIERENWVGQAAQLAKGLETDGKRAYREGRHT